MIIRAQKNFINSFVNYSKKIKSIDTQLFTGFQYSNFDQDLRSLARIILMILNLNWHKIAIKNLILMFFRVE